MSHTTTPNPYDVLGITCTASSKEIKAAYQRALLRYHPDKRKNTIRKDSSDPLTPDDSVAKFHQVQAAWRTLSNADSKYEYDLLVGSKFTSFSAELVPLTEFERSVDADTAVSGPDSNTAAEHGVAAEVAPGYLYSRGCRCGDRYEITSAELESGVDCIPCNSCSFSIRIDVPAAAVEDSEDEQEQEQEREGEEGAGGR